MQRLEQESKLKVVQPEKPVRRMPVFTMVAAAAVVVLVVLGGGLLPMFSTVTRSDVTAEGAPADSAAAADTDMSAVVKGAAEDAGVTADVDAGASEETAHAAGEMCIRDSYVTTLAAFNDVTQPMLKRGRAELTDFPYHFASRCVHLPELMRAINSALFALRERQSLRRQQEENRNLLARQYAGITDILRQLGAEVTQDVTAQPMMERQVRRYASAFGWIDHVLSLIHI